MSRGASVSLAPELLTSPVWPLTPMTRFWNTPASAQQAPLVLFPLHDVPELGPDSHHLPPKSTQIFLEDNGLVISISLSIGAEKQVPPWAMNISFLPQIRFPCMRNILCVLPDDLNILSLLHPSSTVLQRRAQQMGEGKARP